MLTKITFTTFGSSPLVGGFKPGDTARVPADTAAHLVNEARCAEYAPAPAASGELLQPQPEPKTTTARRPRRATGENA